MRKILNQNENMKKNKQNKTNVRKILNQRDNMKKQI